MTAINWENLSVDDIEKLIKTQEAQLKIKDRKKADKKNSTSNHDDAEASDESQNDVFKDTNSSGQPPFNPVAPPGGWTDRDLYALGSSGFNPEKPYDYNHIEQFYQPLREGEAVGSAIFQAAKFMHQNLGGVFQNNAALFDKFGVYTGHAWCMNFVNATLRLRGLKTTGSDAAISALRLGRQVSALEALPGDIVIRGDGHHVGFYIGKDRHGRMMMIDGNSSHTVKVSYINPGYGVFIRHSGEKDPNAVKFEQSNIKKTEIEPPKTFGQLRGQAANTNTAMETRTSPALKPAVLIGPAATAPGIDI